MGNINRSVGRGGQNVLNDVCTVNNLLNNVPESSGGPERPLNQCISVIPPNPYMSHNFPRTETAIKKFQWRQFPIDPHTPEYGRVDPRGTTRTLQRLNQFEPPNSSPTYTPQVRNQDARRGTVINGLPLLFTDIWNRTNERIEEFQWTHLQNAAGYSQQAALEVKQLISPEKMIAIFWEETNFHNIRGRATVMWGFGQVNSRSIPGSNTRYGNVLNEPLQQNWAWFRSDPNRSIDFAILAFIESYRVARVRYPGNRLDWTLAMYARGPGVSSIPSMVHGWKSCFEKLETLQLSPRLTNIRDSVSVPIREALWEARPGTPRRGQNPDLTFPP